MLLLKRMMPNAKKHYQNILKALKEYDIELEMVII
jgi:hypothetical protein